MYTVIRVKLNERAVVFHDGLPHRALGPGRYVIWRTRLTEQRWSTDTLVFQALPEVRALLPGDWFQEVTIASRGGDGNGCASLGVAGMARDAWSSVERSTRAFPWDPGAPRLPAEVRSLPTGASLFGSGAHRLLEKQSTGGLRRRPSDNRRRRLASDRDLRCEDDRDAERRGRDAHRSSGVLPSLGAEQLDEETRASVDDARGAIEAGGHEDEAVDPKPRLDAIEIADLAREAAQHRERRQPRRLGGLLEADVPPDAAERPDHSAVGRLRGVARKVDHVAVSAGPREVDDHVLRHLGRLGKIEASFV